MNFTKELNKRNLTTLKVLKAVKEPDIERNSRDSYS